METVETVEFVETVEIAETVETVETEETVETVETEENFFCKIAHTFLYTHILYFAETHIQTKEALAG